MNIRIFAFIISIFAIFACSTQSSDTIEEKPDKPIEETRNIPSKSEPTQEPPPQISKIKNMDDKKGETLSLIGTIRYVEIEGGAFVFDTKNKQKFTLLGLPKAMKKDGLRLKISALPVYDRQSTLQYGQLIQVTKTEIYN